MWRMQLDSSRNHIILVNQRISRVSVCAMFAMMIPTCLGACGQAGMCVYVCVHMCAYQVSQRTLWAG